MSSIEHTVRHGSLLSGHAMPVGREAFVVDLPRLYRALWPQRRAIIAFTCLCVAATLAAFAIMPPRYDSAAALLVNPGGLQVVERDLRSTERFSNSDDNIVDTQMRVMTTDSVLKRVVASMELAADPEFAKPAGIGASLRAMLGIGSAQQETPELRALRTLRERVWTARSGSSYVIEIHARTKEPEKSAAIANEIANAYLDAEFDASAQSAQRAAESLSTGLDELRIQVREAESAVARYKAEHDIAGGDGRLVTEQQLSELNVQLMQATVVSANARNALDQWERLARNGGSVEELSETLGSQTISQLRAQYALLDQRRAEARLIYGDRHPSIRTITMQLESMRDLLRQELRRMAGAARNTYERAIENESTLRAQLEGLKQKTFDAGFAQVRLRELERQLETNRTVYQAFLQRAQEVSEQKALDVSNARIVTIATVAERPTRPPLLFLLALSIAAGLGLSIGYLVLREQMRQFGWSSGRDAARRG